MRKYTKMMSRSRHGFQNQDGNLGNIRARENIERECGHSISHWIARHSRSEWRWFKPFGVPTAA